MAIRTMARWAKVTWHLAGGGTTFEAKSVPLGEDPAKDRAHIRAYLARRYLSVPEAAPLIFLDEVEEYEA